MKSRMNRQGTTPQAERLVWCCKGTDGHEDHCIYHSPFQIEARAVAPVSRRISAPCSGAAHEQCNGFIAVCDCKCHERAVAPVETPERTDENGGKHYPDDDLTPEEVAGIAQGLQDAAAGRTKPLEQIEKELSAAHAQTRLTAEQKINNAAERIFGISVEAEHNRGPEWGVETIASVLREEGLGRTASPLDFSAGKFRGELMSACRLTAGDADWIEAYFQTYIDAAEAFRDKSEAELVAAAWKLTDKVAGLREENERLKRQLSSALTGEDDALRACREKGK